MENIKTDKLSFRASSGLSSKKFLLVMTMGCGLGCEMAFAKCWTSHRRAPVICASVKPLSELRKSNCAIDVEIKRFYLLEEQKIDHRYIPEKDRKYTIQLRTDACNAETIDFTKVRFVLKKTCEDRSLPKAASFQFVQLADHEKCQMPKSPKN